MEFAAVITRLMDELFNPCMLFPDEIVVAKKANRKSSVAPLTPPKPATSDSLDHIRIEDVITMPAKESRYVQQIVVKLVSMQHVAPPCGTGDGGGFAFRVDGHTPKYYDN